jgi:hypothetical protein
MAPVSGLLAHALERHEPHPGLALGRVSYEILGLIRFAPTTVRLTESRVVPDLGPLVRFTAQNPSGLLVQGHPCNKVCVHRWV